MGFQELAHSNGLDRSHIDNKKWVITGVSLRPPLKPIYTTTPTERDTDDDEDCSTTTPRAEESRIPAKLTCPPAPRKRKQTLKYRNYGGVREFFTPPDLETVFLCQAERAK